MTDSPSKPRLLFAAHTLPFPENSGSHIRIANLLRAACMVAEVQFVGYVEAGSPDDPANAEGIRQLKALCPSAIVLPRDPLWWPLVRNNSLLAALRHYVMQPGAFVFREFRCGALISEVRRLAPKADLIWIERLWVAHHLRDLAYKAVVDMDDLESVKIQRRLAEKRGPQAWAAWLDWWKTRRTESSAARDFSRIAVCSEHDVKFWPKDQDRVWVVPNGFDDHLLTHPLPDGTPKRAIFVGLLDYWPNVGAIQFFAQYVMPLLLQRYPDFEFWIVGRSPHPAVLALDNGRSIRVFPNVPSVVEYVRQAAVSVVPLRVGGGTRLKILESIGAGVPVVSTDVGIEGINLTPEIHYLRANSAEEFAEAVIRLMEQPEFGRQQVERARSAIRDKYAWSSIRASVADLLRPLLAQQRKQGHDFP
ncbi:MAG: glycosyltransferase family 4 protein [Rhodocyclaceae bacterium]|jgi:glycosyltransferase involved in cell wall biosynthesis|nr:glycosyltransferase family 4 protein [Rhodocyclaceae bacterium]